MPLMNLLWFLQSKKKKKNVSFSIVLFYWFLSQILWRMRLKDRWASDSEEEEPKLHQVTQKKVENAKVKAAIMDLTETFRPKDSSLITIHQVQNKTKQNKKKDNISTNKIFFFLNSLLHPSILEISLQRNQLTMKNNFQTQKRNRKLPLNPLTHLRNLLLTWVTLWKKR